MPELSHSIQPPHSIEAEQSVIGALLIDNSAFEHIADMVRADDFYTMEHQKIFAEIVRLIDRMQPVDAVTLGEKINNIPYLVQIHQNTPSARNARAYAQIVRDRAIERRLMAASYEIYDAAAVTGPVESKLAAAEAALTKVVGTFATGKIKHINEILTRAIEKLDERFQQGPGITGVPTGFVNLDELTSGLHAGDLIVLAGRPSMGKSALADQIVEYVAMNTGPALFFSLEMTDEQLVARRLAGTSRIPLQRIRTGRLEDEDWKKLTNGVGKLNDLPIYIDDTPNISAAEIRAKASRQKRETGLSLIVVDYMQLMRGEGPNRNEEIAGISRALKAIAKELRVPLIAVSQLSRKCDDRTDRRPIMSDLRESGQIEQDADLIIFIYRDEVYHPNSPMKGTAEIIVAKQRMGPRDTVILTFVGDCTRFENYCGPPITALPPIKKKRGFEYE